jgi:hypothetical protein
MRKLTDIKLSRDRKNKTSNKEEIKDISLQTWMVCKWKDHLSSLYHNHYNQKSLISIFRGMIAGLFRNWPSTVHGPNLISLNVSLTELNWEQLSSVICMWCKVHSHCSSRTKELWHICMVCLQTLKYLLSAWKGLVNPCSLEKSFIKLYCANIIPQSVVEFHILSIVCSDEENLNFDEIYLIII